MNPPREAVRAPKEQEDAFSIVCHDLKDPLAAIVMGTNLLLKTVATEEDRTRRVLEAIARAAGRLDTVIRHCHDVTRLEQGRLELQTKPHALREVLESAATRLDQAATKRGVRVQREIEVAGERIVCDADRIAQVVEHLGDNAMRYTRSGFIVLGAEVKGPQVMVRVRDEGPGISEHDMATLFDWRANATRATRDGTGLGLALVKGIVESHGGTVSAESKVGKGSTFQFSLPLSPRKAPAHR